MIMLRRELGVANVPSFCSFLDGDKGSSSFWAGCRYLGSMGLKLVLFGSLLWAFLALSQRSKESARQRAAELFTAEELLRSDPLQRPENGKWQVSRWPAPVQTLLTTPANSPMVLWLLRCLRISCAAGMLHSDFISCTLPALWVLVQPMAGEVRIRRHCLKFASLLQANRGGEASTSAPTPVQAEARSDDSWQSANGSSTSAQVDGADPAWLQLPVIHYALMQGNQQPQLLAGHWAARHAPLARLGVWDCDLPLPRLAPSCHAELETTL